MKKTIAFMLSVLAVLLMVGCSSGKTTESTPASPTPSSKETVPSAGTPSVSKLPSVALSSGSGSSPSSAKTELTATIKSTVNDYEVTKTGEESVSVKGKKRPAAGDTVTATVPGKYVKVKATGISSEPIIYLPDGVFSYTFRSNSSVYMPGSFVNAPLNFTFSIPTAEELSAERNLALNPFDFEGEAASFPHVASNNVYDASGQFIPRNAIDGYVDNKGHGNYPKQSWGPRAIVNKTDSFTVDFGREVSISSVALYLRADGFGGSNSHDAYFSEITLEFSDGSTVKINPQKIADCQTFTFDEVKTNSLKLTGFVTDKSDSQGWAAITEISVAGKDVVV